MFKSQLLDLYPELTAKVLQKLLNQKYFEELKAVGYEKTEKFLTPKVVKRFIELFGEPITLQHENI